LTRNADLKYYRAESKTDLDGTEVTREIAIARFIEKFGVVPAEVIDAGTAWLRGPVHNGHVEERAEEHTENESSAFDSGSAEGETLFGLWLR